MSAVSLVSLQIYVSGRDLGPYARSVTITVGRSQVNDNGSPGQATIVLRNLEGQFSTYWRVNWPSAWVTLWAQVSIQATHLGYTYYLYSGYVTEIVQNTHMAQAEVTVTCMDVQEVARLTGFTAPSTPYTNMRVDQILYAMASSVGFHGISAATGVLLTSYMPPSGSLLQAFQDCVAQQPGGMLRSGGSMLAFTVGTGFNRTSGITRVEALSLDLRTSDVISGVQFNYTRYASETSTVQATISSVVIPAGDPHAGTYPGSFPSGVNIPPGLTYTINGTVPLPQPSDGTALQLTGYTAPTLPNWSLHQIADPTSPTVPTVIESFSLNTATLTYSIALKNNSINEQGILPAPGTVSVTAYVQLTQQGVYSVGGTPTIQRNFTALDPSALGTAENWAQALYGTLKSAHPRFTATVVGHTDEEISWILGLGFGSIFQFQDWGTDLNVPGTAPTQQAQIPIVASTYTPGNPGLTVSGPWLSQWNGDVVVQQMTLTINTPAQGQPQVVANLLLFDSGLASF